MTDMQNAMKEVDIQVVYRRLEARKRNISRDGQMSKRQIASSYRGYHGLETQYHALQQMSNKSMINVKHKNDHLQNKHVEEMKHLIEQEQYAKGKSEKDLKAIREDFTAQLAYQYVYKNHSFKRIYKSQQQKKPRPVSDKPELYDQERRNSAKVSGPRPLGSLRQMEAYRDELKFKFPPIAHHDQTDEINSPRVNMMGEKSCKDLKSENIEDKTRGQEMTSFPKIEDIMGIEVKFKYKPNDDDRISAITAPPAELDAENEDQSSDFYSNLINYDMGQNLLLMRQKDKEKHRVLPPTPAKEHGKTVEVRKESWRRVLPETPNRPSTVFQGATRNSTEMKKVLKKEATDVMSNWDSSSVRREAVEIAKERHKASLAEHPIPLFDRSRPTSAILRDYREFKKHKDEEQSMREQIENDQTIIVRQMSPQPRARSPVAEIRSKYMHTGRVGPSRDESPTYAAPLHRTDSDKFPSVSRTSSYKDIPETDTLFQENALLTAAERIALEKEKRMTKGKPKDAPKQEVINKVKRRLPTIPVAPKSKVNGAAKLEVKQSKLEPARMFNTSILAKDRDVDMINRVKLANLTHDEGMKTEKPDDKQQTSQCNEHNQYMPIVIQRDSSSLKGGKAPFPTDSATRIKTANALYGKDLWPKLSRQMKFDYENYTRTTPDSRKRLETRAKNRKKIQQKNVQLAEELKMKTKTKGAARKEESDRPSTRVSFNENVIVFQTI